MLPSFASAGNRLALALAALRGQGAATPKPAPVVPLSRPHRAGRKSSFAYAPYLALGALVMLLANAPA